MNLAANLSLAEVLVIAAIVVALIATPLLTFAILRRVQGSGPRAERRT